MKKLTQDDIYDIIKLYKNNVSSPDIARKFKVDPAAILYHLKKHNISRRRCGAPQKYEIDESIFEEINTPEKAYWLGFLYADGWISKNGSCWMIGLSLIDIDSMEKYRDFICPSKLVKKKKTYKGKQPYYLHITNVKIATDLIKHGCVPRKSTILTFPDFLDDDLLSHFVREYFDGDGCLSITQSKRVMLRIMGSEQFIKILIEKTKTKLGINCNSRTYKNIHEFMICGNRQIDIFLSWLYNNSTNDLRMERKYKKYQEFLVIRSNTRGVH